MWYRRPVAAHRQAAAIIRNASSRRSCFWYVSRMAVRATKQQSAKPVKIPTVTCMGVSPRQENLMGGEEACLENMHMNLAGRLDEPLGLLGIHRSRHAYRVSDLVIAFEE